MNYNNNKIFSELIDCILEMTTDDVVSYQGILAFEHLYRVVCPTMMEQLRTFQEPGVRYDFL